MSVWMIVKVGALFVVIFGIWLCYLIVERVELESVEDRKERMRRTVRFPIMLFILAILLEIVISVYGSAPTATHVLKYVGDEENFKVVETKGLISGLELAFTPVYKEDAVEVIFNILTTEGDGEFRPNAVMCRVWQFDKEEDLNSLSEKDIDMLKKWPYRETLEKDESTLKDILQIAIYESRKGRMERDLEDVLAEAGRRVESEVGLLVEMRMEKKD